MAHLMQHLLDNACFQSIQALLVLAAFRTATLLGWLPAILLFAPVVLLDGFMQRIVKSKEFLQHDPEWFALHICAALFAIGAAVAALFIPCTLPPSCCRSRPP